MLPQATGTQKVRILSYEYTAELTCAFADVWNTGFISSYTNNLLALSVEQEVDGIRSNLEQPHFSLQLPRQQLRRNLSWIRHAKGPTGGVPELPIAQRGTPHHRISAQVDSYRTAGREAFYHVRDEHSVVRRVPWYQR